MLCPNCDLELTMSERQGVEIDYCPKCRGVWLDRGELDKIIDRSIGQVQPKKQTFQNHPRLSYDGDDRYYKDQKHYKKKRKRKSLLEEIFDFG